VGAFSLPLGLTGGFVDLWGLARDRERADRHYPEPKPSGELEYGDTRTAKRRAGAPAATP